MKKEKTEKNQRSVEEEDTMRAEYDFSHAVRGITSKRYREGTNVVVLDPDVACMFPDSESVNNALRSLGQIVRSIPKRRSNGTKRASA